MIHSQTWITIFKNHFKEEKEWMKKSKEDKFDPST